MWLRTVNWLAILLLSCAPQASAQDDFDFETPGDQLASAIDSGSVAAVRRLLDSGNSPNTVVYESPALMWAIWGDRYFVTKLLIDRGADVNLPDTEGYTSLMAACSGKNLKIAKLLLDKGADINAVDLTYGMSALQSACEAGNEKVVDLLIERGADVNHIDKYGGNCLEEAAFYGRKAIYEKLLAKGVKSRWPLHVACGLGDAEQVKKLLANGADVNQPADVNQTNDVNQPNGGWKNTPLHFAAGAGHVEIGELLVERGASLDTKNVLGGTPLHVSGAADTVEFAKWLVKQGADINAKDEQGGTPLDWSLGDAYDYLDEAGADHGDWDVEVELEEE